MIRTTPLCLSLLLLLAACGDKDAGDDSGTGDGGASDGGSGDSGSGDGGSGDGGSGDGGSSDGGSTDDAPFHASGTYDGEAFQVECYFDGSDPDYTASLLCQGPYQIFASCRLDPEDDPVAGLDPAQFQVWFYYLAEFDASGTYDLIGKTTLCVGDNSGAPLCTHSDNAVSAELVVDEVTLWTHVAGSFSGSWDDSGDEWAGDHTAEISGTFDLDCSD